MDAQQYVKAIAQKKIPETPPDLSSWSVDDYKQRTMVNEMGVWAAVSMDWVNELAEKYLKHKKVLEIMGGSGLLAKALSSTGLCKEIVCTDDYSWVDEGPHTNLKLVYDVEKLDALAAIEKYKHFDVLICSWPPYDDDLAYKCLKTWDRVYVHIGEGRYGCTANDRFFDKFKEEDQVYIPQWRGMHDYVMIGRRK